MTEGVKAASRRPTLILLSLAAGAAAIVVGALPASGWYPLEFYLDSAARQVFCRLQEGPQCEADTAARSTVPIILGTTALAALVAAGCAALMKRRVRLQASVLVPTAVAAAMILLLAAATLAARSGNYLGMEICRPRLFAPDCDSASAYAGPSWLWLMAAVGFGVMSARWARRAVLATE